MISLHVSVTSLHKPAFELVWIQEDSKLALSCLARHLFLSGGGWQNLELLQNGGHHEEQARHGQHLKIISINIGLQMLKMCYSQTLTAKHESHDTFMCVFNYVFTNS